MIKYCYCHEVIHTFERFKQRELLFGYLTFEGSKWVKVLKNLGSRVHFFVLGILNNKYFSFIGAVSKSSDAGCKVGSWSCQLVEGTENCQLQWLMQLQFF